jgi:aryl-phospho-beta-D-glucosidase BglC (GH1 family)
MTDCAAKLNGLGNAGARYDGTIYPGAPVYGSCVGKTGLGSTFTQNYKNFLRKTWEAQVRVFGQISTHSRLLGGWARSLIFFFFCLPGHYV